MFVCVLYPFIYFLAKADSVGSLEEAKLHMAHLAEVWQIGLAVISRFFGKLLTA